MRCLCATLNKIKFLKRIISLILRLFELTVLFFMLMFYWEFFMDFLICIWRPVTFKEEDMGSVTIISAKTTVSFSSSISTRIWSVHSLQFTFEIMICFSLKFSIKVHFKSGSLTLTQHSNPLFIMADLYLKIKWFFFSLEYYFVRKCSWQIIIIEIEVFYDSKTAIISSRFSRLIITSEIEVIYIFPTLRLPVRFVAVMTYFVPFIGYYFKK